MDSKMKSLWLFFLVGLATGFLGGKSVVSSHSTIADDLYIEDQASGDFPVDDEDGEDQSGSGSGDDVFSVRLDDSALLRPLNPSKKMLPLQPQPTSGIPSTTLSRDQNPGAARNDIDENSTSKDVIVTSNPTESTTPESLISTTLSNSVEGDANVKRKKVGKANVEKEVTNEIQPPINRDGGFHGFGTQKELTSENLWKRTEVLAAVIACGVVGFLCAVFLLLLLAYRMKKKDEGSYDLGDNKLSATAYHKAPTKEFFA